VTGSPPTVEKKKVLPAESPCAAGVGFVPVVTVADVTAVVVEGRYSGEDVIETAAIVGKVCVARTCRTFICEVHADAAEKVNVVAVKDGVQT